MTEVDWKHGNIEEVAKALHEKYNLSNITYQTGKNVVIFLSDKFFVGAYYYFPHESVKIFRFKEA